MKLALAQILAVDEDRTQNLNLQIKAIANAKEAGADFILFPEMFDIGYTQPEGLQDKWRNLAISQNHPYINALKSAFAQYNIWGTINYMQVGNLYPRNSMLVVNNKGESVCNYSKIHLFEPFENDACCEPGDQFYVFDFPLSDGSFLKIGTMICADRDFPESARILMKMGAELIISPNACPLNNILSDMLRVRALENALALATVNYPSPKWDGHSALISPWGEYIERLSNKEDMRVVEIPSNDIKAYRKNTNWGDAFRKEYAYDPIINCNTIEPFANRKNKIGIIRNRSNG